MKTVLITGASGTMGGAALTQLAESGTVMCRVLLRPKSANRKFARRLQKKYQTIEILFGDLQNYTDCLTAVMGADYILHCAAVIPPLADHHPDETYRTNYIGTVQLLTAVQELGQHEHTKFVHIGTVAEYGNRTFKHPWGRTGDPLMPSACDIYAATKVKAERAVIESPLCWVSLRQSGILYDDVLFRNMDDGLMFHTCWNTPIEWATARTSGLLEGAVTVFRYGADMSWVMSETVVTAVYNSRGGPEVVSGMSAGWTIANLFFLVFPAIHTAVGVIVGGTLGRNALGEARLQAQWLKHGAVLLGVAAGMLEGAAVLLIPVVFARLTPEAHTVARMLLVFIACYMPLWCFQNAQYAVARAGGDTAMGAKVDPFVNLVLFMPSIFLLYRFTALSAPVMYALSKSTTIVKAVLAHRQLKKEYWVKNLTV